MTSTLFEMEGRIHFNVIHNIYQNVLLPAVGASNRMEQIRKGTSRFCSSSVYYIILEQLQKSYVMPCLLLFHELQLHLKCHLYSGDYYEM